MLSTPMAKRKRARVGNNVSKANNRTTNAAQDGLAKALNVAFTGGSVMGSGNIDPIRTDSNGFKLHFHFEHRLNIP